MQVLVLMGIFIVIDIIVLLNIIWIIIVLELLGGDNMMLIFDKTNKNYFWGNDFGGGANYSMDHCSFYCYDTHRCEVDWHSIRIVRRKQNDKINL